MMAEPLTKRKKTGERYTRPPAVEANIDGALRQGSTSLQTRLAATDEASLDYLRSECLVYLIRRLTGSGDRQIRDSVALVLLGRCEKILRSKIDGSQVPNADCLREEILGEFALLLASDGTGDNPDELDYFECRFNRAFRFFRIDMVRAAEDEMSGCEALPVEIRDSEDDVRSNPHIPYSHATQAGELETADLLARLPPKVRKAFVLCQYLGYEAESDDPSKVTAATLCKVSGRTIRNWLKQAKEFLSRSLEEEI